jgi:hypothetical protein
MVRVLFGVPIRPMMMLVVGGMRVSCGIVSDDGRRQRQGKSSGGRTDG